MATISARLPDSAVSSPRSGFTLVEMLVVVAIIAILVTLTAAGSIAVIGTTRKSNTEKTLTKLHQAVNGQWQAVVDQAKKESLPAGLSSLAGNNPVRARVVWIKMRLAREFPTSTTEAFGPSASFGVFAGVAPPARPTFVNNQVALGAANAAVLTSACLYLALKQNRGVEFDPDSLGSREVTTDPNSGLRVFTDAWGNPLQFTRWAMVGAGTDLQDPEGTMAGWASLAAFRTAFNHPATGNTLSWDVASAGQDGLPNTPDDLHSSFLRLGARADQ